MQEKNANSRLYLLASIWILYGIYRIFKAIVLELDYAQNQLSASTTTEILIFGAFSLSIGLGLLFRSKFLSLELLSLPLALLAYSIIWTILLGNFPTSFLKIDYIALLLIIPTGNLIRQQQISAPIGDWSIPSLLFWVMIEIFLFNGLIFLLV